MKNADDASRWQSMFAHPQFDPVATSQGPLAIRWYGLMHLTAFALFACLNRIRARRTNMAKTGRQPEGGPGV